MIYAGAESVLDMLYLPQLCSLHSLLVSAYKGGSVGRVDSQTLPGPLGSYPLECLRFQLRFVSQCTRSKQADLSWYFPNTVSVYHPAGEMHLWADGK